MPQGSKAKGRKIGRNIKHQASVYAAMGRYERNRKRALRRHLRDHPFDMANAAIYTNRYGKVADIGYSGRGRRRLKRQTKRG